MNAASGDAISNEEANASWLKLKESIDQRQIIRELEADLAWLDNVDRLEDVRGYLIRAEEGVTLRDAIRVLQEEATDLSVPEAHGDEVTDDAPAIQAQIYAGQNVFLPKQPGSLHQPTSTEQRTDNPTRDFVHSEPAPHEHCAEPSQCPCECRGCIRAYFDAGRPTPQRTNEALVGKGDPVEVTVMGTVAHDPTSDQVMVSIYGIGEMLFRADQVRSMVHPRTQEATPFTPCGASLGADAPACVFSQGHEDHSWETDQAPRRESALPDRAMTTVADCDHANEHRLEIHSRQAVPVIGLIPVPVAVWCKRCGALQSNGRWRRTDNPMVPPTSTGEKR